MSERCFIIGAGEFDGFVITPGPEDLLIAADGGYQYALEAGVKPSVLIGDFDSILPENVPSEDSEVFRDLDFICYPKEKDDTDMALAAAYAQEKGYRQFLLYGGLGGRLDHTIANLQLLNALSQKGLEAYLIGQGCMLTAITDESAEFPEKAAGLISVFCIGRPALGVSELGLKYTLKDAALTSERALGVSNEFIGCRSRIEVKNGTLLLFWDSVNGLPQRGTE